MNYFRKKTIKGHDYNYEVRSVRRGRKVRQIHVAYLGADISVHREYVREGISDRSSSISKGKRLYLSGKPFIVFDCETTGFQAGGGDKIIEVAFQKFRISEGKLESGKKFHSYVNPQRSIPWKISELTGIYPELVRKKPPIEGLIEHIAEFIGNFPIVGHNVSFDFRFLNHDLEANDHTPISDLRKIDTLSISRTMYGRRPSGVLDKHNLRVCSKRERVKSFSAKQYHSASHDVSVTAEIFHSMMSKVSSH